MSKFLNSSAYRPSGSPVVTKRFFFPLMVLKSALLIFVIEFAIMLALDWLGLRMDVAKALIDAMVLTLLAVPVLYWFMVRPIVSLLASKATALAEKRMKVIANAIQDGVVIYGLDNKIQFANPYAERLHGLAPGTLVGQSVETLMPEGLSERFHTSMRQFRETGHDEVIGKGVVEAEGVRKNGERFPLELTVTPVGYGEHMRFVCIFRDISERKRMESEIARMASFPRLSPNPIMELDAGGRILLQNPASVKFFELSEDSGSSPAALLTRLRHLVCRCLDEEEKILVESEINGRTMLWTMHPVLESGTVHVRAIDLTERKQAEEALRASELQLRNLLETLPLPVKIVQGQGVVYCNRAVARMLGYSDPAELIGIDAFSLVAEKDRDRMREYARNRAAGAEASPHYEADMLCRSGSSVPVEVFAERILFSGSPSSLLVLRDLTEEKRLHLYHKILPICLECGQIRDDKGVAPGQGRWLATSEYLAEHSDAMLSHGYCPQCYQTYLEREGLV